MTDLTVYSHLSDGPLTLDRDKETQTMIDQVTRELAARELDHRFLDALESGEIEGDVVTVDEDGQEVKSTTPPVSIFDVD